MWDKSLIFCLLLEILTNLDLCSSTAEREIHLHPRLTDALEGDNVTVPCWQTLPDSKNFTFYKNNKIFARSFDDGTTWTDNKRTLVMETGSVVINDVTREDSGLYTCRESGINSLGNKGDFHKLTVHKLPVFFKTQEDKSVCNGERTLLSWSYTFHSSISRDLFDSLLDVRIERSDKSRPMPNNTDLTVNSDDDVTEIYFRYSAFFNTSGGYTCVVSHGGRTLLTDTTHIKVLPNAICWPKEDAVTSYALMVGAGAQFLLVIFMFFMLISCLVSIMRTHIQTQEQAVIMEDYNRVPGMNTER